MATSVAGDQRIYYDNNNNPLLRYWQENQVRDLHHLSLSHNKIGAGGFKWFSLGERTRELGIGYFTMTE